MSDQLTRNLDAMIYHQRLAERLTDSGLAEYHHAEALRYRAEAQRLESRAKVGRKITNYSYISLN